MTSQSKYRMRFRHYLGLGAAFLGILAICAAQDVNPQPSPDKNCPDGSTLLTWSYPPDGGLPSNATSVPCDNPAGCYSMPISACLQLVDVTQSVASDLTPLTSDKKQGPVVLPPPP